MSDGIAPQDDGLTAQERAELSAVTAKLDGVNGAGVTSPTTTKPQATQPVQPSAPTFLSGPDGPTIPAGLPADLPKANRANRPPAPAGYTEPPKYRNPNAEEMTAREFALEDQKRQNVAAEASVVRTRMPAAVNPDVRAEHRSEAVTEAAEGLQTAQATLDTLTAAKASEYDLQTARETVKQAKVRFLSCQVAEREVMAEAAYRDLQAKQAAKERAVSDYEEVAYNRGCLLTTLTDLKTQLRQVQRGL